MHKHQTTPAETAMAEQPRDAKAIFLAAVELPQDERAAFVADACGSDAGLRVRVEELLAAHERDSRFASPSTTPPPSIAEGPGTRIGPYKLLQLIGEGGMGLVWMAEQQQPIRRQVALKVIKAGMD